MVRPYKDLFMPFYIHAQAVHPAKPTKLFTNIRLYVGGSLIGGVLIAVKMNEKSATSSFETFQLL